MCNLQDCSLVALDKQAWAEADPGALLWRAAHLGERAGRVGQGFSASVNPFSCPLRRVGDGQPCERCGAGSQRLPVSLGRPEDLVNSQVQVVPEACTQQLRVEVQLIAAIPKYLEALCIAVRWSVLGAQPLLDVLQEELLLGLVAVKLKAEVPKSRALQPSLDDFERRELFRDEEHFLAGGDRRRDDVRDGLRLARARGAVDDEVLAELDIDDGAVLRRVGVVDQRKLAVWMPVDVVVLGMKGVRWPCLLPAEDAAQKLAREQATRLGRIEVCPDGKLAEREEAQRQACEDLPVSTRSDRKLDFAQVVHRGLLAVELRHFQAQLTQLFSKGEVLGDVLPRMGQLVGEGS